MLSSSRNRCFLVGALMASILGKSNRKLAIDPPVIEVTVEEGRRMFDEAAQEWLGITGEEFLRRYDAGEYADLVESEDNRRIVDLYLMIPFAR